MKRQIKFRALELDTGNWVYGGFVSIDGYAMSNGVPDLNEPVTRYYIFQDGERREVAEETVGQFTGLLDKNGVEIYEGDAVVAYSTGSKAVCEVKWGQGRVGFFLFNEKLHKGWSLSGGGVEYNQESCEVIGNIHNNPKLLEKGNE
ncbi:hypothetical protein AWJ09_04330 [Vibrio cholerae]|uniref:YopX family protein n=1 Tax=Vibrio cholerae TaxID=666 RepID=UPI0007CCA439|nr:YopX family protein [Vibrio cholerae]OAE83132.1 hypothetical protein AWJ09_04330 [Vibrio cholerae]